MSASQQENGGDRVFALIVAILISAAFHLLLFIAVVWSPLQTLKSKSAEKRIEETQTRSAQAKLNPTKQTPLESKKAEERKPKPPRQVPMIFVDTDSSQPTGEVPPEVKYYGKRDTVAANPEVDNTKLGENPLIKGTQTKVPSTADVPFTTAARPTPPAPASVPIPVVQPPVSVAPVQPEQKIAAQDLPPDAQVAIAEPPRPGGDKPAAKTPAGEPKQVATSQPQQQVSLPHPRIQSLPSPPTPPLPTTRQTPNRLSKMTDSSVARRGTVSLNVKGTPFGVYDEKLVAAVARRWHLMLQGQFFGERSGVVVIHFILKEDGTIPEITIEEENVGPVLAGYCRAAIAGSAPFESFTQEMVALLGKDRRELDFVFYY